MTASVPYVKSGKDGDYNSQFFNSFENTYTTDKLSKLNKQRLMFLPLVVDAGDGVKVCITESDLENYPGLYLFCFGRRESSEQYACSLSEAYGTGWSQPASDVGEGA